MNKLELIGTRDWRTDGSDNDAIRTWLADPANVGRCAECPYLMGHPHHDALPCGQYNCWVELDDNIDTGKHVDIKLISVDGVFVLVHEEFEDYDVRFCGDGGSYYQPYTVLEWDGERGRCKLIINDTSCGNFGSRIDVSLYVNGTETASARYGTMLSDDEEATSFNAADPDQAFAVYVAAPLMHYYRIPIMG